METEWTNRRTAIPPPFGDFRLDCLNVRTVDAKHVLSSSLTANTVDASEEVGVLALEVSFGSLHHSQLFLHYSTFIDQIRPTIGAQNLFASDARQNFVCVPYPSLALATLRVEVAVSALCDFRFSLLLIPLDLLGTGIDADLQIFDVTLESVRMLDGQPVLPTPKCAHVDVSNCLDSLSTFSLNFHALFLVVDLAINKVLLGSLSFVNLLSGFL
jgi:hypothetical protein